MPEPVLYPTLTIAVCDDNPSVLAVLCGIIRSALPGHDISLLRTGDPEKLLEGSASYQIAVLDVCLANTNGIQIAQQLLERNSDCQIIFVSGYTSYVSAVYEVPHLGMVLKEQLEEQLPRFLQKAVQRLDQVVEQTVTITERGMIRKLRVADIRYIEHSGRICTLVLRDGTRISLQVKLDELVTQCEGSTLVRCHASYAVNLRYVAVYSRRKLRLKDGVEIPVSRANEKQIRQGFIEIM